jgi:rfaE bifunctional protein nucleotidyltransferase chain/domain
VSQLPVPEGLVSLAEALARRAAWAEAGERVVLTNGCFDLLHAGHVRYLAAARARGDRLVVALNDDAGVRRLKGPGRPLMPLSDRAELLAALRSVDLVVAFGQDTAVDLVRALAPEVYAKGGDYGPGNWPPEASAAAALGAEVAFLALAPGRSTTALARRLADLGR